MEEKQPTQPNNENLKTVKTYMSDMAETVRQNEISVIKVALAEQNKHEREDLYRKVEGTTSKKFFWAIGGIVILAGAIYGSYYLLGQKKVKDAPAPIVREESIISYDGVKEISLGQTNSLIKSIVETEKNSQASSSGNIDYIKIYQDNNGVNELITIKTLFSNLRFNAPASLVRSLSDSYMMGIYAKSFSDAPNDPNSKPKLFMIFQSNDYEYSYAGMLEWEKTMASEMIPLFKPEAADTYTNQTGLVWKDIIISNKDARVVLDESGKPMIYYLFIDKNKLLITESTDVIKEVTSRLMIKNMKPL